MQKLSCPLWLFIALFVLVLGMSFGYSQQPSAIDEEHTKWIGEVMRSIETIKPGMTRGDLKNVFVEEGGLSTRAQRKYVYKTCPYIKVDVTFAPADDDKLTEKPEDKIVSISHAYLEYPVMD
jgi:hypothetical protein